MISVRIEKLHLNPGLYNIGFWLANPSHVFDHIELGGTVEVIGRENSEAGHRAASDGLVTCSFSFNELSGAARNQRSPLGSKEAPHILSSAFEEGGTS